MLRAITRREDYDADSLDALAEQERRRLVEEGVLDAEPVRVYKLRCQACLVLIGPGYAYDEVWYDARTDRWICRSCALWPSMDRTAVYALADRSEVAELSIGDLGRTLQRRVRAIKKQRRGVKT